MTWPKPEPESTRANTTIDKADTRTCHQPRKRNESNAGAVVKKLAVQFSSKRSSAGTIHRLFRRGDH
jgi:hypothetical protein